MAPRLATRPARENDFSDVGKVGRRTGVVLPHGRLDVNGMEEISGIFSSPRKPSPLRKSMSITDAIEDRENDTTPRQTQSARKSLPPPRSASPRKSGISGTARRNKTVDLLGNTQGQLDTTTPKINANTPPVLTPTLLSSRARRFSPEKSPLKDVTATRQLSARVTRQQNSILDDSIHNSIEVLDEPTEGFEESELQEPAVEPEPVLDDYILPAAGDDDQISIAELEEQDDDEPPLPPPFDDEEVDQTFELEARSKPQSREPTIANSRRKRKSDALDQETEAEIVSSPAAKRAKRISDQSTKQRSKPKSKDPLVSPAPVAQPKPRGRGRPSLKDKDAELKLSSKQKNELDQIVEKVKARPGQKKSLYILKRDTPAEDGVTHTRSGRITVKPLAYWRNEKCVFGGSPGGASLQDGARFPLNSIKEIIRTEELVGTSTKKSKKSQKGKRKTTPASQPVPVEASDEELEESSEDSEDSEKESDSETWEKERGIFRGPVAVWDANEQEPIDEDEEMDIAYAPASIELREVKGSTFRYAKMLSMRFFGSGIVDLPPGSIKKTKNSRRMHMSFFVATGRVTVQVGPLGGPENRFSIGTGGWWQVPRGNQYSIENTYKKPAKVFFSQACEPMLQNDEELAG